MTKKCCLVYDKGVTIALVPKETPVPPGSIADKIRKARDYHRPPIRDRADLAAMINKASSSIGMYETGKRLPPPEVIRSIAAALRIPFEWFIDGKDTLPPMDAISLSPGTTPNADIVSLTNKPQINLVPYWGAVPCGDWERPSSDDGELIQVTERIEDITGVIAVRVRGNSMNPRLMDGQIVSVRLSSEKQDGRIVLAQNGDKELTLKALRYTPLGWRLDSINPDFGSVCADEVTILGYAIALEETELSGLHA